jgi:quercetin dioxygenase-like cupin family protein
MQQKYNESTPQRPEGRRPLDAPLVKFDLNDALSRIRNEEAYKNKDRNAITLFKSDKLCYVLIALHAGAEMKTHATAGMSSLQVLSGSIDFRMGNQILELKEGEMITIHEHVPHGLLANTESAILLTMTTNVEGEA